VFVRKISSVGMGVLVVVGVAVGTSVSVGGIVGVRLGSGLAVGTVVGAWATGRCLALTLGRAKLALVAGRVAGWQAASATSKEQITIRTVCPLAGWLVRGASLAQTDAAM
jgi:hypothetical protein